MKKLVPAERSSRSKIPPASSTPNASKPRIAVTNQPHTVSGMRIRLMPGARMSIVVAMKFSAPSSDARQKSEMLMIHIVWPHLRRGP